MLILDRIWTIVEYYGEIQRIVTCINKITTLQRRAYKRILRNEYINLEEARDRLKILSFNESVFLQKAKVMYKVANNIAPNTWQICFICEVTPQMILLKDLDILR